MYSVSKIRKMCTKHSWFWLTLDCVLSLWRQINLTSRSFSHNNERLQMVANAEGPVQACRLYQVENLLLDNPVCFRITMDRNSWNKGNVWHWVELTTKVLMMINEDAVGMSEENRLDYLVVINSKQNILLQFQFYELMKRLLKVRYCQFHFKTWHKLTLDPISCKASELSIVPVSYPWFHWFTSGYHCPCDMKYRSSSFVGNVVHGVNVSYKSRDRYVYLCLQYPTDRMYCARVIIFCTRSVCLTKSDRGS